LWMASRDRRRGVFLSRAMPVYAQNALGMKRVTFSPSSLMKTGLVQSQAVYPRASKVARSPPEGKDEASGSPWYSSLPLNSMTTPPPAVGEMKESCFSAVRPVMGWNQ